MISRIVELLKRFAAPLLGLMAYGKGRADGRSAAAREALEAQRAEAVAQQQRVAAAPRDAAALTTLLRDKTKDF